MSFPQPPTKVQSFADSSKKSRHRSSHLSQFADALTPRVTNRSWDRLWPVLKPGQDAWGGAESISDTILENQMVISEGLGDDENDNAQFFYDPSVIGKVFNKGALAQIIQQSRTPLNQFEAQRVLSGQFQRILTILAMAGHLTSIGDLVDLGLDDSCLPLFKSPPKPSSRKLSYSLVSHEKGGMEFNLKGCVPSASVLDTFIAQQYRTMVPFLYRPADQIPHYVLSKNEILPFEVIETLDNPNPDEDSDYEEVEGEDAQSKILAGGGFAKVFRVKFYKEFHDFNNVPLRHESGSWALKRLIRNDRNVFLEEVHVLKRLQGKHDRLIPLVMTFQTGSDHNAELNFIFPWASGDLRVLWTRKNATLFHARWLVEQCHGLVDALKELHADEASKDDPDDPAKQAKRFGRHGDIKPDNVLLFDQYEGVETYGPTLVLADFGFGRFHRLWSRSARDPKKTPASPTYRAPEFVIRNSKITRRSDIWSLACTFLELVTWYLLGARAVREQFPDAREDFEVFGLADNRVTTDVFWQASKDELAGRLKPGVTDWIARLHDSPKCSQGIHDFLKFIEWEMLEIDGDKRIGSGPASAQLKKILESNPKANSAYWTTRASCRCSRPTPVEW